MSSNLPVGGFSAIQPFSTADTASFNAAMGFSLGGVQMANAATLTGGVLDGVLNGAAGAADDLVRGLAAGAKLGGSALKVGTPLFGAVASVLMNCKSLD